MQNTLQQAKDLILKSDKIAVISGYDLQGDAFAAGLALFYTLRKLGKKTNLISKDEPKQLAFLREKGETKKTILTINSRGKEFQQMRYEKNHDNLKIYFTLAGDEIALSDISIATLSPPLIAESCGAKTEPELLVCVGIQNMETLTMAVDDFSWLYQVPLLNIDNQITNEEFGNLNLIDHSAVSLSEIITDLLHLLSPELLDNKIATQLLSGVICATRNFQHPKTGPGTLSKAAQLLERGADHEKIIKHLYKTKTLSQVRLLGKALQNMRVLPEREVAITTLTKRDFEETEASSRDLARVLEDIKSNFSQLPSLILLWENHGSATLVKGILSCKNSITANKVSDNFEGVARNNTVLFLIREADLEKAEEQLLSVI